MVPLRILLLEDVAPDAELVQRQLRKEGLAAETHIVWDRESFRRELDSFEPQVIVSDFSMPQFSAVDALQLLQDRGQKIPFILYTGTQSEEAAVTVMKLGADDYLLKSSLTRLPSAITNALERHQAKARERDAIEALRRSEQSFRALIEGNPDAIAVLHQGVIAYANPALAQYLARDAADLAGREFCELVHENDRESCRQRLESLDAGEASHLPAEVQYLRSDGAIFLGESVGIRITFNGRPAVAIIVRDITERKHMQAQLLLADRLATVGTLAAGVAHEINNPLGYMIANLQFVDEDLDELMKTIPDQGPTEKLRDALAELTEPLKIARRGADRVKTIVRDLMTLSRADNEGKVKVDVRDTLEFTLKMAATEIKRKADVVRDFQEVPPILANESRLGQVFLNLLINAAQAMPAGQPETHRITVSTAVEGALVRVEIADTGSGIPQSLLSRIFDPFFTTKPVGQGTGLGLSISHSLVTSMGGTIHVESSYGEGTRFILRFPIAE
jgi:PAS domain S-box-containing protein